MSLASILAACDHLWLPCLGRSDGNGSDTLVRDCLGSDHATIYSAAWMPRVADRCMSLWTNGASNHWDASAATADYGVDDSFSWMLWWIPTTDDGAVYYHAYVSKYATGPERGYALYANNTHNLLGWRIYANSGLVNQNVYTTNFTLSQPHCVVVTYDAAIKNAAGMNLYLDGGNPGVGRSANATLTEFRNSDLPLRFAVTEPQYGAGRWASAHYYAAAAFHRVLTSAEAAELYAGGQGWRLLADAVRRHSFLRHELADTLHITT